MRVLAFSLVFILSPVASIAEEYSLNFRGKAIGSLRFGENRIVSQVTSAPMGLGNGRFEASIRPAENATGGQGLRYLSDAPAKGRQISVLYQDGVVVDTVVSPSSDSTEMSDHRAVPPGVVSPVTALDRLVHARGCPQDFSFYDGRRVISVAATNDSLTGSVLSCEMSYRVTHGPGHLSPLYIKRATLRIAYDMSDTQRMDSMSISSGPFTLNILR